MVAFRTLLAAIFVVITAYTLPVIANHGLDLFGVFFGDFGAFAWGDQFKVDFACFLLLSALWTAWRNDFTPAGLGLGVVAFFGGALFLSAYLFALSLRAPDMATIMLGARRAGSR